MRCSPLHTPHTPHRVVCLADGIPSLAQAENGCTYEAAADGADHSCTTACDVAAPTADNCGPDGDWATTKGCKFAVGGTVLRVQPAGAATVEGEGVLNGVRFSTLTDSMKATIEAALKDQLDARRISAKYSARASSRRRRLLPGAGDAPTAVEWEASFGSHEEAATALSVPTKTFEAKLATELRHADTASAT